MGKGSVQIAEWKLCQAQNKEQYTTRGPRVYKHAGSHMKHTFSSQSKPVSSRICLYI